MRIENPDLLGIFDLMQEMIETSPIYSVSLSMTEPEKEAVGPLMTLTVRWLTPEGNMESRVSTIEKLFEFREGAPEVRSDFFHASRMRQIPFKREHLEEFDNAAILAMLMGGIAASK